MRRFLSLLALLLVCPSKCKADLKVPQESTGCPAHWIDSTLNGLGCLFFNSSRDHIQDELDVTWLEAAYWCQQPENNASLVQIDSEVQLDFVRSVLLLLQDNEVLTNWWTGATDIGREGNYYWAGSLDPVEDFVWSPGQPNAGADANCLILYAGWGYLGNDVGCVTYKGRRSFICQKK